MGQIVTRVGSGNGSITYEPTGYSSFYGDEYRFTATPAAGYVFDHWEVNENGSPGWWSDSGQSTTAYHAEWADGDTEVVAFFTTESPGFYTVTVVADPTNGGTVSGNGSYVSGTSCTITATPNSGWRFVRWRSSSGVTSTNAEHTFDVNSDVTWTAYFTTGSPPRFYTVSVAANPTNGGTVSGDGSYVPGRSCTITATPYTGWLFSYWRSSSGGFSTDAAHTFTVDEDVAWTAYFTTDPNYHTVTVVADPTNGGTVSGDGTYGTRESCTITATPYTGWRFSYWSSNPNFGERDTATYTFIVDRDETWTAHFVYGTYFVTIQSSDELRGWVLFTDRAGRVAGFSEGETCRVRALARTDYEGVIFDGWYEGDNLVTRDVIYEFLVTADRTLTARFRYGTYIVAFDKKGGTGGTDSVMATYGEALPAVVPPKRSGYVFLGYFITRDGVITQYYSLTGVSLRTWDYLSDITLWADWRENAGTGKLLYGADGKLLYGSGGTLLYDGDY